MSLLKRWKKENRPQKEAFGRKSKTDSGEQNWTQKALEIEVDVRHPESFDLLQAASL